MFDDYETDNPADMIIFLIAIFGIVAWLLKDYIL